MPMLLCSLFPKPAPHPLLHGLERPPMGGCTGREGTSGRPQQQLDRRLEKVAKAVGGGYCRLQMPLKLASGVRGTVAGHIGWAP